MQVVLDAKSLGISQSQLDRSQDDNSSYKPMSRVIKQSSGRWHRGEPKPLIMQSKHNAIVTRANLEEKQLRTSDASRSPSPGRRSYLRSASQSPDPIRPINELIF